MTEEIKKTNRGRRFKTIAADEYTARKIRSRQTSKSKEMAHSVLVEGRTASEVAVEKGLTKASVCYSVNKFIESTSKDRSKDLMSPEDFNTSVLSVRKNRNLIAPARMYLVEGASLVEASRIHEADYSRMRWFIKRLRHNLVHSKSLTTPDNMLEDFPSREELDDMEGNPTLKAMSQDSFNRAYGVLADGMTPYDLSLSLGTKAHHITASVNLLLSQVARYRRHSEFPKSSDYISKMKIAVELARVYPHLRREAVLHYLTENNDLDAVCIKFGQDRDTLIKAIRYTVNAYEQLLVDSRAPDIKEK